MNYVRRPIVRGGVVTHDYDASYTADEVIEAEPDTFTGLFDHDGTPLHRQREPIGYQPHRWSKNMAAKPDQKKPVKSKGKGKSR